MGYNINMQHLRLNMLETRFMFRERFLRQSEKKSRKQQDETNLAEALYRDGKTKQISYKLSMQM